MIRRPGGELATRPLHFIWIADCSGSMGSQGKIQALNNAVRRPSRTCSAWPTRTPTPRCWCASCASPAGRSGTWGRPRRWPTSSGRTSGPGAPRTWAGPSSWSPGSCRSPMSDRALPPVLVLISDGQPTDDFGKGWRTPLGQPWGKKAVRVAIAIGDDADLEVMRRLHRPPGDRPPAGQQPRGPGAPHPVGLYRRAAGVVPGQPGGPPSASLAEARLGQRGTQFASQVAPFRARRRPGRRCPRPGAGRDGERRGRGTARPRPTSGESRTCPSRPPGGRAPPGSSDRERPRTGPRWRVVGTSVRGAAHRRRGLPNQDALRWWPATGEGPRWPSRGRTGTAARAASAAVRGPAWR